MTKSYSELILLDTFAERFEYLKLDGKVSSETFGSHRYLNQALYKSPEWKRIRREVIIRDNGCDLGIEGYDIYGKALIHHINPITIDDIINRNPIVFDMNNLVTTTTDTHNLIHYGSDVTISTEPTMRTKNDTCPWRL